MECADLIEFSKNHTFKVVAVYLAFSILTNLGRYDFNVAISFILLIFFDHIIMRYTLVPALLLSVSCILDIVWFSIEGPISHHYANAPSLKPLATFAFVMSILNLVFKVMLIACIVSNPHPEQYEAYHASKLATGNQEFSKEPSQTEEHYQQFSTLTQSRDIDHDHAPRQLDDVDLEDTHSHSNSDTVR